MKTLAEIEKQVIRDRLKQFQYDIPQTADSLGVSRMKIYRFIEIERARKVTK